MLVRGGSVTLSNGEEVIARFKLAGTNEQMECAPADRKKTKKGGWLMHHLGLAVFEERSIGPGDYRRYSLIRPGNMPPNRRLTIGSIDQRVRFNVINVTAERRKRENEKHAPGE